MTLAFDEITRHRARLRAHCTTVLRSAVDADDAVQETLVRAWRSAGRFEGRAAVQTWLFRIATNVCIDMLRSGRRVVPTELEDRAADDDPAGAVEVGDDVRHACLVALLHLTPSQRTVLVLREGLHWRAKEVAVALGTTTAAVNSAMQRARGALAARPGDRRPPTLSREQRVRLGLFVDALRRQDAQSLIALR